MSWLFLEPPAHLLEKTDAPLTRQTCGEHRPGLPGEGTRCGACLWGFSGEHFPLARCSSHPPAVAWPFSSPLEVLRLTTLQRGSKGSRLWGAVTPGTPLAPPYTAGSAGESCLLGCFHHYDSVFFNALTVFSVKTGIETSMLSSHYICLLGFVSNPSILIKPFLDDSLYRLLQCKWRDP